MSIRARSIGTLMLGTFLSAPGLAQGGPRMLSPAQMEQDLFDLFEELQAQHGGLYRYATPEVIEEAFSEAMYEVAEEADVVVFYRIVSELLATVRCGHTSARISPTDQGRLLERRGMLPFEVILRGERMWITRPLGDELPLKAGMEVLSIDGLSIPEIRRRAFSRMSGDGFIETGKERSLEGAFALRYLLVAADLSRTGDYLVTVAGGDVPLKVAGLRPSEYDRRRTRRDPGPVVKLDVLDGGIGLLDIRGFGDPGGGEPSFPDALAAAFGRLKREGIEHLVVDLRGNGGGDDTYGALLVSYLTDEPFGYFDRIEVTADYEGEGGVVERDGSRHVTDHPGLQVQKPSSDAFGGEAWLLIDGRTFSTAADVATVVHHLGLATLAGEETGGGYDGNTSGTNRSVTLSNSGFGVRVPCWMYTTANVGHDRPGRGAPPHHPVRASVEDLLAGRDVEVEYVLEIIRGD